MRVDFRAICGASGVLGEQGLKTCLAPAVSLSADRIETSAGYHTLDLAAIEGRCGHTLRRHVGLTDAALVDRALRTHHDVSCFNDTTTAQQTVDRAFAENQGRIGDWVGAHRRANLDLHVHFDRAIGRVFRYDTAVFQAARDADVILERNPTMEQGFTVITAYPSAKC